MVNRTSDANQGESQRNSVIEMRHAGEHDVREREVLIMDKVTFSNNSKSTSQSNSTNRSNYKQKLSLIWNDISYMLPKTILSKCLPWIKPNEEDRQLIKSHSGSISSGQLVAIIGPSGAGKTTLLRCISGRQTEGLTGDVHVQYSDDFRGKKKISIAFLDQKDSLLDRLTVRESLTFASRIKNGGWSGNSTKHHQVADQIITQFGLVSCANNQIINCSGGQQRRLSIGLELINAPKFLLLDEPTSGLDSSSALQCVQLMRQLVETENLAIMVSLHQPSARILSLFHRIYILSHDGRLLFNDKVDHLASQLSREGYTCPPLHNIADHAIELASGVFGQEPIDSLASSIVDSKLHISQDTNTNIDAELKDSVERVAVGTIVAKMLTSNKSRFFFHLYLLTIRTLILTVRTPWLNVLRLLSQLLTASVVSILYTRQVGGANGCAIDLQDPRYSLSETIDKLQAEQSLITDNLSMFFFSLMFHVFCNMMQVVMTFPLEMSVMVKERSNGCYSCLTYYLAKSLADFPFTLANCLIYVCITYYTTGQLMELDRFLIVLTVGVLMSLVGQSTGLLVGALWVERPDEAMYIAPTATLPFFMLSGFFVKVETMPAYLKPLSSLSYWRWGFEAIIVAIYGLDRCDKLQDSPATKMAAAASRQPVNECTVFGRIMATLKETGVDFNSLKGYVDMYIYANPELKDKMATVETDLQDIQKLFDANSNKINETVSGASLFQHSLVLNQFQLTDYDLIANLSFLLIFVFLCRLLAYIVLYYKASHS
ncbi:ATP-binding cassette sub-family G member 1 [Halotydeus destructor]|nr:ATP-binding cassette sub-family G member 1 [Halotydeus destructor]